MEAPTFKYLRRKTNKIKKIVFIIIIIIIIIIKKYVFIVVGDTNRFVFS